MDGDPSTEEESAAFRAAVYSSYERSGEGEASAACAPADPLEACRRLRGRRLYVKGLPYSWQREAIRECLRQFGRVERLELSRGRPGTAIVDYETPVEASGALVALDGRQPPGARSRLSVTV